MVFAALDAELRCLWSQLFLRIQSNINLAWQTILSNGNMSSSITESFFLKKNVTLNNKQVFLFSKLCNIIKALLLRKANKDHL